MTIKEPIFIEIFTKSVDLWPGLQDEFRSREIVEFAGKNFCLLSVDRSEIAIRGVLQEVTLTKRLGDLPPLESTVRIVPGDVTIWDVAEQFVGVDCRLKAIFMLGETHMVAVECIETGQCCCFWASMVRTPEQAKAEERAERIAEIAACMAEYKEVEEPNEKMMSLSTYLHDHGCRMETKP